MTQREISRGNLFSEIDQKRISKADAAKILGISYRHLHRLYNDFKKIGIVSLVSKQRGKRSNRHLPDIVVSQPERRQK